MKTSFIFSAIFATTLVAQAEIKKLELLPETAVYKIAPGSDLAQANCLTCHSAEYASTQPPMPRAFWKASVDKMIAKYGASISTNQVDGIADYLAHNYGTETNAAVSTAKVESTGTLDAEQLANKWGCVACHVTQKIGPDYKEVAKKYKDNPEATAKVIHQIENGGTGQWGGTIPMPPFTDLSMAEKKALAAWVLSQ